ncbi:MAG: tripartite tricarboxylate transporter substrate binding protein [Defluviitaleaceae bacterium]|nr:tripartite tricarboxylate transporter substrate binding protein [Defluviitaleaceae bacterium]
MKKAISAVLAATLLLAACTTPGGGGGGAAFPSSTINLTVAFGAGGGTDLTARAFQAAGSQYFNDQPITVSNVTGGGGATWYSQGHLQDADGYEVTVVTVEIVTLPLLQDVPFTPDDYRYVVMMNFPAAAITVHADSPWYTLQDLLDEAAENPSQIRVGNSGVNAIWDLHTHALSQAAGVSFNHIPYEGAAPAVVALMAGEIDAVAVSAAEVSTQVLDGTFRLLAVAASERLDSFPDVPTHGELGLDVPNIGGWRGLALPAGASDEVVAEFEARAAQVIASQEFNDIMSGADLTVNFLGSADFTAYVQEQQAFFADMIEELGLRE